MSVSGFLIRERMMLASFSKGSNGVACDMRAARIGTFPIVATAARYAFPEVIVFSHRETKGVGL